MDVMVQVIVQRTRFSGLLPDSRVESCNGLREETFSQPPRVIKIAALQKKRSEAKVSFPPFHQNTPFSFSSFSNTFKIQSL